MDETRYNNTAEVTIHTEDAVLRIAAFRGISIAIEDVLRAHGCTFERYEDAFYVIFPAETVREETLPKTPDAERCVLRLPDGYTVWQIRQKHRTQSLLYCE